MSSMFHHIGISQDLVVSNLLVERRRETVLISICVPTSPFALVPHLSKLVDIQ